MSATQALPATAPFELPAAAATVAKLQHAFEEHGYAILRGAFSQEVVQNARKLLETLVEKDAQQLAAAGKAPNLFKNEPFETRMYKLYKDIPDLFNGHIQSELHHPSFFPYFFNQHVLDLVEGLIGGELRLYPNYFVRPKLPGSEKTQILWHQDAGYTYNKKEGGENKAQLENLRMVNLWTSFVPATEENGCMQFIPGTHKLGLVPHTYQKYYLEIDKEYLEPHLSKAVTIAMQPGDVVLFSNLLYHWGLPNRAETIRWSLDFRYQDATQSTLRATKGHIARSRKQPETAVRDAKHWTELTFQ